MGHAVTAAPSFCAQIVEPLVEQRLDGQLHEGIVVDVVQQDAAIDVGIPCAGTTYPTLTPTSPPDLLA